MLHVIAGNYVYIVRFLGTYHMAKTLFGYHHSDHAYVIGLASLNAAEVPIIDVEKCTGTDNA